MRVRELDAVPADSTIEADVCLVGTGPAGLTIAHELSGPRARVLVLESGGLDRTERADALNEIESVGAPRVLDQWYVRNRMFGGTSSTWAGKVASFDEMDFADRDWVPGSGWPISRTDLVPYFRRSMPYLGVSVADNNSPPVLDALGDQWVGLDAGLFRPYSWSFSRDPADAGTVRFGPRALRTDLPGVDCYLHATVTDLETNDAGDRLVRVGVRTPEGSRRWVRARSVVLSAGAIENARLLLASGRSECTGVGNRHDQVGRYLMDHLRGAVGVYRKDDHVRVQQLFRRVRLPVAARANPLHTGVALSPRVQQDERLLNCALFLHTGPIDSDDPLRAVHDLVRLRRPAGALATVARQPRAISRAVVDRALLRRETAPRAVTEITLQCMVEQRPDADSRVTLSRRTDAHGVPLPVIDWRTSDEEARTVRFAATRFAAEMRRLGLPEPELPPMIANPVADFRLTEMAHPTGTTRMSADPHTGVVDTDCAVHGVRGLYVAGSSVFPTAGHANPTQMIVALAIRLADHLKNRPGPPLLP